MNSPVFLSIALTKKQTEKGNHLYREDGDCCLIPVYGSDIPRVESLIPPHRVSYTEIVITRGDHRPLLLLIYVRSSAGLI